MKLSDGGFLNRTLKDLNLLKEEHFRSKQMCVFSTLSLSHARQTRVRVLWKLRDSAVPSRMQRGQFLQWHKYYNLVLR